MCDNCNNGVTLVRRNPFVWERDGANSITVRKACGEPALVTLTEVQYEDTIELVTSKPEGIELGAGEGGGNSEVSLGKRLISLGKAPGQATKIAAIAVAEGLVEAEDPGIGQGGLWLLPLDEVKNRAVTQSADKQRRKVTQAVNSPGLRPDVHGAADALHALAERVISVEINDSKTWRFNLSEIDGTVTRAALDSIATWERQANGAKYLYRFRVDTLEQAEQCHEAFLNGKLANANGRRFSRLNGDQAESTCLYVGSSQSVAARTRQHLGLAHGATYALQVAHWKPGVALTGNLHLDITRFSPATGGDVLQALEDDMWSSEKPRFGKMGAR